MTFRDIVLYFNGNIKKKLDLMEIMVFIFDFGYHCLKQK